MNSEYAIEADPGMLTASFPLHATYDAALTEARSEAFYRVGVPPARVLVRNNGGPWCVARTVTADELRSAYRTWSSGSAIAAGARAEVTRAAARSGMTDEEIDAVRVECGLELMFTAAQEQGELFEVGG